MTGQTLFDSYEYAGVLTAADLVNVLPAPPASAVAAIAEVLAIDRPSAAAVRPRHVAPFTELAARLRQVFEAAAAGDVDRVARRLNTLLATHPAHPHLAQEDGRWRLHHHPADAGLAPMYTAICAEGLARIVGAGEAHRLGTCAAPDCDRVFFDVSKNASRRFCSTTCQNRVKATAFRRRHHHAAG